MKKIIIGLLQIILCPFIIILGYYLINSFNVSEYAFWFASIMGGAAVIFIFSFGCALIIRGLEEEGIFRGW